MNKGISLSVTIIITLVIGTFVAYSQNFPDLTVTDIIFIQPSNCTPMTRNITVNIKMKVENIGNVTAFNFTDRLQLNGNEEVFNFFTSQLEPNAIKTHSVNTSRKCFVQFTANATTDVTNKVQESNEANNNRFETYTPT